MFYLLNYTFKFGLSLTQYFVSSILLFNLMNQDNMVLLYWWWFDNDL